MGIVFFILIFCIVVIVHELGHFLIAKANGIHVVEFTLGMGPCLISTTRGGTKYAIRLLPIGGACIFEGEDGLNNAIEDDEASAEASNSKRDAEQAEHGDAKQNTKQSQPGVTISQEESDVKEKALKEETEASAQNSDLIAGVSTNEKSGAFPDAPVWARIATVVAGPFFNFILAFLFSTFIIGSYGTDLPIIQKVSDGGAAQEAGMLDGDKIVKIDGKKIHLYREISLYSMLNRGEDVAITYERDGKLTDVTITPKYSEADGRYYMGFLGVGVYEKKGFFGTLEYSGYEVSYWIRTTIKSLELMIQGKVSKDDVSGPVGMAQTVTEIYDQSKPDGFYYIMLNMMNFAILLSANLGVLNLLPFPALDGGRLVFLVIEAITGKKIPPEKEGLVHLIGMVFLMALMALVLFNDIGKLHLFK